MDHKESWVRFCGLSASQDVVDHLAGASYALTLAKNQSLVEQDDDSKQVYLVESGQLEARYNTVDGVQIWLADLHPGDIVGELSALQAASSRTSDVIAVSRSKVLRISQKSFLEAMEMDGTFALIIAKLLAERIANSNVNLTSQIEMTVANRLYIRLVKLASKGPGDQEEMLLEKRPPIAKLKSMIHATRESTSRALTELEKQGLIEKSGGKSLKVRMPPKPVS